MSLSRNVVIHSETENNENDKYLWRLLLNQKSCPGKESWVYENFSIWNWD